MTEPAAAACPKCGRARGPESSCARCGLVFERWRPDDAPPVSPIDEMTERLWDELAAHWQDESRHEAFLKRCALGGHLGAAGRLYRGWLDGHPDDPIATRMQARIVGMATVTLTPSTPARPPLSQNRGFWWLLVGAALLGLVASLLFRALNHG